MLAFLKRWRQAYLEDKGNRLHAEVEAERDIMFRDEAISLEEVNNVFADMGSSKTLDAWAEAEKEYYEDHWVYNYDNR